MRRQLVMLALLSTVACGGAAPVSSGARRAQVVATAVPAEMGEAAVASQTAVPAEMAATPAMTKTTPKPSTNNTGTITGRLQVVATCDVGSPCPNTPVAGAQVTITNDGTGAETKTKTDANGKFRANLAEGSYEADFAPADPSVSCDSTNFDVSVGETTDIVIACSS